MKKITCFLFVLLLSAIYSINASANHSKFINTWVGYAIPLNESDIIGFVTPVIALKNDNTGSYSFLINANFKIDNKTSIDIKLAGNIPYKWALDENNILVMHLDKDKFYMNITDKCFKINTYDDNVEAIFELYKDGLIKNLNNTKQVIFDGLPEYIEWTNAHVKKSKLYLTDNNGTTSIFTRGKTKNKDKIKQGK